MMIQEYVRDMSSTEVIEYSDVIYINCSKDIENIGNDIKKETIQLMLNIRKMNNTNRRIRKGKASKNIIKRLFYIIWY